MSIVWGDGDVERYSYMFELVWMPDATQGVCVFCTANNSTRTSMIGDWEQYLLPRAMVSCIQNECGDHLGYLRNLYDDADQYDTIHDFIGATFPGIQPCHAWVGYSNRYPTQDSVYHAVDWYIQHPPEYLSSSYQH